MTVRSKLDPETKIELLIKMAFGISLDELAIEYELTKPKIINLRKNNYLKYNEFFEHWKIDKEIAVLGLSPKHERAASIVKKFYKSKITISKDGSIFYKNKSCNMEKLIDMADSILKLDNITGFKETTKLMKNNY